MEGMFSINQTFRAVGSTLVCCFSYIDTSKCTIKITCLFGTCRKVYVCSRYPHHHCTKWCPASIFLVDHTAAEDQQVAEASPAISPQRQAPSPAEMAAEQPQMDADEPVNCTPPSQLTGSQRTVPPAPSKSVSWGSVTSRTFNSSNVRRNLAPFFNQYAPAAIRANRLGGRFVTLKPQAHAIVQMQRRMSGQLQATPPEISNAATDNTVPPPTKAGANLTTNIEADKQRKRPRPQTASTTVLSVRTASLQDLHAVFCRQPKETTQQPLGGRSHSNTEGSMPHKLRRL